MPIVNWVLSNPLYHKYRYAQQHSVTKWKWYIGPNRFRRRIRLIYWGEKKRRQKWLSSAFSFRSSFYHYQLLFLECLGALLGLANRKHQPDFRGQEGTEVWLFLWLLPGQPAGWQWLFLFWRSHLLLGTSLLQLLQKQFDLQLPYSFPFDLQTQNSKGSHSF